MAEKTLSVLPCSSSSSPKCSALTETGPQHQQSLNMDSKLNKVLHTDACSISENYNCSQISQIQGSCRNSDNRTNCDDGDQHGIHSKAVSHTNINEKEESEQTMSCGIIENHISNGNQDSSSDSKSSKNPNVSSNVVLSEKINGLTLCSDSSVCSNSKHKSNNDETYLNASSPISCNGCKNLSTSEVKSSEVFRESCSCDKLNPSKNNTSDTGNIDSANEVDKMLHQLENTSLSESQSLSQCNVINGISYIVYESEKQMPDIMRLITKDLSEPYSIYTYRYFIHNWPKLCFLAEVDQKCVGAIVCKLDMHKKMVRRGYIAMLAVDSEYRRRQIGSSLVTKAIQAMIRDDCDEVVLETEITNQGALNLYENLGFVRDKRLFRYYLNGVDALRLKLWLR